MRILSVRVKCLIPDLSFSLVHFPLQVSEGGNEFPFLALDSFLFSWLEMVDPSATHQRKAGHIGHATIFRVLLKAL